MLVLLQPKGGCQIQLRPWHTNIVQRGSIEMEESFTDREGSYPDVSNLFHFGPLVLFL